jgi:neuronal calcium sensor 1
VDAFGKIDVEIDNFFRVMDENNDGTITFIEFLTFQAIATNSASFKDILSSFIFYFSNCFQVTFSLYDDDQDGYVTVEELRKFRTNVSKAEGKDVTSKEVTEEISKWVESMFSLIDTNQDGKLTKEEMTIACEKDPSLIDDL